MLKRHRSTNQPASGQPPAQSPVERVASVALTLPVIDEEIPAQFNTVSGSTALPEAASLLAEANLLKPSHWRGDAGDAVCTAIRALAESERPQALAPLHAVLKDDLIEGDNGLDYGDGYYARKHNLPKGRRIGGLLVTILPDDLYHVSIGDKIKQLENHRSRLGRTVLHVLHEAFDYSCRALDPVSGYGWAQSNYWMGELDEQVVIEEQLDDWKYHHEQNQKELPPEKRKPFNREEHIKKMDLFTKAHYDADIPPWAGSALHSRDCLSLPKLQRLRVARRYRRIVQAAVHALNVVLKTTPHPAQINDINIFEACRWQVCPYLIRWHCPRDRKGQDCLAMIYDDFMNNEFQSGESQLDVNAVFAYHDGPSFLDAMQRFRKWCRVLNAAENLLRTFNLRPL